jgi:hypothetical protein
MLTTTGQPSRWLFRAKEQKALLLKQLLRSESDVAVCHKAFLEAYQKSLDLKVYQFDCVIQPHTFSAQLQEELLPTLTCFQKDSHVFLFGSREAQKSKLLSLTSDKSLLQLVMLKSNTFKFSLVALGDEYPVMAKTYQGRFGKKEI